MAIFTAWGDRGESHPKLMLNPLPAIDDAK
jgi:hypothetical protein